MWTKQYDLTIGGDDIYSVAELANGGYVVCGLYSDTAYMTGDAYIMKLDAQGDSLWMKRYGSVENENVYSIAQTLDGGFVVAGRTFNTLTPPYSDAWVFKTDSSGNLLWEKQFDEYGFNDGIKSLVVNSDSTIVIGGETLLNTTTSKAYLVKLTNNGDTIWKKEFGPTNGNSIFHLDTTVDNGYIVAGATYDGVNQFAYAAKLNSFGDVIWEKEYARGARNYSFSAIHELPNGNFMAAGADIDESQPMATGDPRIRLFEMNALGDSLWSKQYSHYWGTSEDYMFDMKLTSDGGYIICGYIINNSLPQLNDVLVIKIDSNGCDTAINCSVGINEYSINESNFTLYPNPTTGLVTIAPLKEIVGNLTVEVYNALGMQVLMQALTKNPIQLSNFNKGVYLVRIINEQGSTVFIDRLLLQN